MIVTRIRDIDKPFREIRKGANCARDERAFRLTVLLHPGHQHCISVSHSLIQLLSPNDPRKSDLCKRIMDVVTRLDPHGVRLSLYTAVTLHELATCIGEDRPAHLSKAASLLRTEPQDSPGEKLLRLIEVELSVY